MILVGVDTGGTFTDVAAADVASGRLWICKVSSTPKDPSEAFLGGLLRILELSETPKTDIALIGHGTTVATNAILERKGARAALVTTEGFRYVLDLGRHDIPRGANLYRWLKPERPITPDLIFEVAERIDPRGAVLAPLREDDVRTAAARIRAAGVQAVAVSLLHSYANPAHERRVAEVLEAELPGMFLSLSADVLPAFREYERTMVTAMNATVMPVMTGYIRRIQGRLRHAGITAPFVIMKSNGGVSGAETIAAQPVYTVLSGPAAGVLGACMVGRVSGFANLISLDMGGTSTDVAICPGAQPIAATETEIGLFPLKAPCIDVKTIGAGGGSIASVLPNGSLTAGPESAGADPGPVCYGKGGIHPTVTDAQVMLGRLPTTLAGGQLRLQPDLAAEAIRLQIAEKLALSPEEAAHGIIEIVTHNMAGAVRAVSIERGHDPADYALIAFGGAGPLHATRLAEILGIRTVVIPRYPGVLSALGLLGTPLRQDYVQTCLQAGPRYDCEALERAFTELEAKATRWLEQEGMSPERRSLCRLMDIRYAHQGYELLVALPARPGAIDADTMRAVEAAFHRQHAQLYGHVLETSVVQVVNVRLAAQGQLPTLGLAPLTGRSGAPSPSGERRVYLDDTTRDVRCPSFERGALAPGAEVAGPAVIDQVDTTVFLTPAWVARVDGYGNLVITPAETSGDR